MSEVRPYLSANLLDCLNDHTAELKEKIVVRARTLAAQRTGAGNNGSPITLPDLSQAISDVTCDRPKVISIPTRAERLFAFLPPFTLVSAGLCAIFAVLGWLALHGNADSKFAGSAAGFLDIAKIFAGAIVGSSAVASKAKA